MEPLITLITVTLVLLAAGAAGVRRLRPWAVPLRGGLAAMFTLTGLAHFVGLRSDLVEMVPPVLPAPGLLVTVTGLLELAGAAGLLWRRTAGPSAAMLTALLVVMFPANVHAELEHLAVAGEGLLLRTVLQVVFVAATTAVVIHERRRPEPARTATDDRVPVDA